MPTEPQAVTHECLASGEDLIDYENELRDKAAKESVEQPDPFVLDRDECTRASFDKAAERVQSDNARLQSREVKWKRLIELIGYGNGWAAVKEVIALRKELLP